MNSGDFNGGPGNFRTQTNIVLQNTVSNSGSSTGIVRIKRERSATPPLPSRRLIGSGAKWCFPIPSNCQKTAINPDWPKNRREWLERERAVLKRSGLKTGKVYFRDDGLSIDWTSDVPVWSDTLQPERPLDLASAIEHTHAVNNMTTIRGRSGSNTPIPASVQHHPSVIASAERVYAAGEPSTSVQSPSRTPIPVPPRPSSIIDASFAPPPSQRLKLSTPPPLPAPPRIPLSLRKSAHKVAANSNWHRSNSKPDDPSTPTGVVNANTTRHVQFNPMPVSSPLAKLPMILFTQQSNKPTIIPHLPPVSKPPPPQLPDFVAEHTLKEHTLGPHPEMTELELAGLEYLKHYVQTFDADRSSLASAYARNALFSYRFDRSQPASNGFISHTRTSFAPDISLPTAARSMQKGRIKQGRLDITSTLVSLGKHKFCPDGPCCVKYDVNNLGEALGVLVVCHGEVVDLQNNEKVFVSQSFVLKCKDDDDEDRLAEGVWPLVAVSHQMTIAV